MVELSEGANLRDALEKLTKTPLGEVNAKYEEHDDEMMMMKTTFCHLLGEEGVVSLSTHTLPLPGLIDMIHIFNIIIIILYYYPLSTCCSQPKMAVSQRQDQRLDESLPCRCLGIIIHYDI